MKRLFAVFSAVLVLGLSTPSAWAASSSTPSKKGAPTPGVTLATTISQITGVAISPMLGVSAVGAYQWVKAETPEEKAKLPWYANPLYFFTGFLIVAGCALKDGFGATLPPGWKKPLDVLETIENKCSGLVAVGAFIPFSLDTLSSLLGSSSGGVTDLGGGAMGGLAVAHLGFIDLTWLWNILLVPIAAVVFMFVWLTAHAINVLILLSPWGAVDAALKSARIAVLSLLSVTTWLDPWTGAAIAILVIIVSYFTAGWAFRLTTYGTIFCWDFFTVRRKRFKPAANDNWVFAGGRLNKETPIRTYGVLHRAEDGKLIFKYRPWLFLPERQTEIARDNLAMGRGAFYPTMVSRVGDKENEIILLPPRYKGHEADFGHAYEVKEVIDVGLRRAWAWLKDALGFGRKTAEPAAPVV